MTVQELEQVIHDYIMDIYNMCYVGKLEIIKLDPIGYCIKFGKDTPDQPLVIYAEMEDNKFLKFLKQELKDMRLNLIYYGKLMLTYPNNCNHINAACSCYDKG